MREPPGFSTPTGFIQVTLRILYVLQHLSGKDTIHTPLSEANGKSPWTPNVICACQFPARSAPMYSRNLVLNRFSYGLAAHP